MMRLTIIPSDGFVNVNELSKHQPLDLSGCNIPLDVHALQWYETQGWVEFNDDGNPFTPQKPNESIYELPEWALACVQVWEQWSPPVPPPPTPEEIQAQNKAQAESFLQATDWTCTVDINNPQYSNPYLGNQDAFLAYRSQLRAIAINPPTVPIDFPIQPKTVWLTVE